jgi:hypothetical protein
MERAFYKKRGGSPASAVEKEEEREAFTAEKQDFDESSQVGSTAEKTVVYRGDSRVEKGTLL